MAEQVARAGDMLVHIHAELRRALALARAGAPECLAFCGALRGHHTHEDDTFPRIEQLYPQLSPVLARLRQEHETVARRIRELQGLIDAGTDVSEDLDRLAAEMEAHFAYEEEHLVPVLNGAR